MICRDLFGQLNLLGKVGSCNVHCIMSINITLTKPAYERLKKLKEPGESFSQAVLRELPERCDTCGEIEEYFTKHGVPKANSKLEKAMLSGRGRRSNRKL
jgi:predicted CopG family antitoxin